MLGVVSYHMCFSSKDACKPNFLVLDVSNLSSLFVIIMRIDDQIIKTPHRFLRARISSLQLQEEKVIQLNHSFLPSSTTSKRVNGNRR